MRHEEGGCLCGGIRYEARSDPMRVTICHCRFCQRATGGAYLVEPIFDKADLAVLRGEPKVYEHVSEGSGRTVYVHFCQGCGTKLYLTFDRWPDLVGVYAGTFDDPCWFEISPENAKQIFLGMARHDTVILPDIAAFREHATTPDGSPESPRVYRALTPAGSSD